MLKSSLCDYIDAYILVSGTITTTGAGEDDNTKRLDEINKGETIKKLWTIHWLHKQNKEDHAKDLDVLMSMCNLIEYSHNYLKTSGSLWRCATWYFNKLWIIQT